jgi:exosortase/archaeosortase family protein
MLPGNLKYDRTQPIFNKKVIAFFIKLFVLFSLWFVCYTLLLRPGRILDRPLTNFLTSAVVKSINTISPSTSPISWIENTAKPCAQLTKNNVAVFDIYDVCNGIDLMFIYVGVLFLLPYPLKRKIIFSVCGIAAIILLNIIRISSLYYIYIYQRSVFDFSHHYIFTLLMYVLIFYAWLLFVKKSKIHGEKSS